MTKLKAGLNEKMATPAGKLVVFWRDVLGNNDVDLRFR